MWCWPRWCRRFSITSRCSFRPISKPRGSAFRRVPRSEIPPGRAVLGGLHFLLAFAVLIWALFWQRWQPERAALLGGLGDRHRAGLRLSRRAARCALLGRARQTGMAWSRSSSSRRGAGIVIGVLNVTGLSFNLTYALVQIGGGNMILLLALSALVCIVLGMGLPTLGVYVLLAALVAPALCRWGSNRSRRISMCSISA
jgi:TRAP-type uncharacterized transport system fused permease subunit